MSDGTVIELVDVKVGTLSADLFTVPPGYNADNGKKYPSSLEEYNLPGSMHGCSAADDPSCGYMDPNTSGPLDKKQ